MPLCRKPYRRTNDIIQESRANVKKIRPSRKEKISKLTLCRPAPRAAWASLLAAFMQGRKNKGYAALGMAKFIHFAIFIAIYMFKRADL